MVEDLPGGWGPILDDLVERRRAARAMGGDERLARHQAGGKLTARARVDYLLDPGTFRELGTLVGAVPADAIVAGSGRIAGRPVMVGAEDFTVVAGTIARGQQRQTFPPGRTGPAGAGTPHHDPGGRRLPPDGAVATAGPRPTC